MKKEIDRKTEEIEKMKKQLNWRTSAWINCSLQLTDAKLDAAPAGAKEAARIKGEEERKKKKERKRIQEEEEKIKEKSLKRVAEKKTILNRVDSIAK